MRMRAKSNFVDDEGVCVRGREEEVTSWCGGGLLKTDLVWDECWHRLSHAECPPISVCVYHHVVDTLAFMCTFFYECLRREDKTDVR